MAQPQTQQRPVNKELEKKKKEQAQDRREIIVYKSQKMWYNILIYFMEYSV